jgi:predicted nucleotidyltransferase
MDEYFKNISEAKYLRQLQEFLTRKVKLSTEALINNAIEEWIEKESKLRPLTKKPIKESV